LNPEEQVNTSFGAPPAPLETKSMPPPPRPNNSRPDISMGRGAVFREEQGIPLENSGSSIRPDMRGPQNLDLQSMLSGLKPQTDLGGDDSLISVSSLTQNGVLPKRTHRRKQRSDKNIVSLDI